MSLIISVLLAGLFLYVLCLFSKAIKLLVLCVLAGILQWGFWPIFIWVFYLTNVKGHGNYK